MADETATPVAQDDPYGYLRPYWRVPAVAASQLAPGALSNFLPDPNASGVQAAIPGMLSGAYSGINAVGNIGQALAGVKEADRYNLPGAQRAGELQQGSSDFARRIVPNMEPQTNAEREAAELGGLAGAVAVPLPSTVASKLPTLAARGAEFFLQGPKAVPVAVAFSGANDLINPASAQASDGRTTVDMTGNAPTTAGRAGSVTSQPGSVMSSTGDASSAPQRQTIDMSGGSSVPSTADQRQVIDMSGSDPNARQTIDMTGAGADGAATQPPFTPVSFTDPSSWTVKGVVETVAGALVAAEAARFAHGRIAPAYRDARYAEASQTYNAAEAALGGNKPPGEQAPVPGSTVGTLATQSVLDDTAAVKSFLVAAADNPTVGRQNAHAYGDMVSNKSVITRYQDMLESGDFHGTKIPAPAEWQRDIAALPDDTREKFNAGMKAANEIENRNAVIQDKLQSGTPFTEPETRVDDSHLSTDDLKQIRDDALADPVVKELMDRRTQMTDGMADALQSHGLWDAATASDVKAAHRFHVSAADIDGAIDNPLRARNITPGTGNVTADLKVWELADQHDAMLYRAVEQNHADQLIVNTGLSQQARPLAGGVMPARLFTEITTPKGEPVPPRASNYMSVRENGVLRHYRVANDDFLKAVQRPPVQMGATLIGINKMRQYQQAAITGGGAVLSGHAFQLIGGLRNAGEIAVMRSKGFVGSHGEKYTGIAGDPITPYLGSVNQMVRGVSSVGVKAVADILDPRTSIGARMEAMFGAKGAQAVRQRAQNAYNTSNLASMRREGLSSPSAYTNKELPLTSKNVSMPSRNLVPELFRMNDWGGAAPTVVKLRNLFDDMRGAIGDAAHANLYALNKDRAGITREALRNEVRQVTGDPGTRGANPAVRAYGSAVPYGNIALQELSTVARRFSGDPLGTTTRFLTHYGGLAAAAVFTAMLAGPDAIQHLFDSTNDQERSKSFRFYVPGQPTTPIELPVMIMMRPAMNLMTQLMYDAFGLANHAQDGDTASKVEKFFAEFFDHHIMQSTVQGTLAGISGGLPPIVPAGFNAAAGALTGKTVDPTLYNAVTNYGKPVTSMFSRDVTGANTNMPGEHGKVDPVTGSADGEWMQVVLSDILGVGGHVIWDTLKQYANAQSHNLPLSHVLDNFAAGYGQRVRDDVPGANLVWGSNIKQTGFTPLQQRVDDALDKMRTTTTWKGDLTQFGMTRKGGLPLPEPGSQQVPSDPTMRQMYVTTSIYMGILGNKPESPLKQISDLRKQMNSLERSPLSPDTVRGLKNDYIKQINDKYVQVQGVIHMLNTTLSQQAGAPVDIRRVNWSKGPEQFSARPADGSGSPAP